MLGRSLTALEEETPSQDPPDEAGGSSNLTLASFEI